MSSQAVRFQVGEHVKFPRLFFNDEGKHELANFTWKIKTIFPVSRLAVIMQENCKKGPSVQVGLDQLLIYN